MLTRDEYSRVENAYVAAALAFLHEAGVSALTIEDMESHAAPPQVAECRSVGLADVAEIIRQLLREDFWCRLEGPSAFVHVGLDYSMYVGVPRPCPEAEHVARRIGLFVEPFHSPHNDRDRA